MVKISSFFIHQCCVSFNYEQNSKKSCGNSVDWSTDFLNGCLDQNYLFEPFLCTVNPPPI